MKKLFVILIISLISQLSQANERFIPLELFTGGKIRDDTEIKFTKANLVFGEKKRKKIVGPEDWKNPQTGKYSSFTIAGSAIGVTSKKFKKWQSTFLDNLSTSIKLHNISKLIVINHEDCGAAK